MIDAVRRRAVVMLKAREQPRLQRHGGAEFERQAERIADMQGAALVRPLDPLCRQAGLLEISFRLFQILLGEAAHADPLGLRRAGALEHQRVMTDLGDAAQIDRVLVLVADDQADEVDIEGAALRQIFHVQYRMAGARDVEGRVVVGFGNGHHGLRIGRNRPRQLDTFGTGIHTRFSAVRDSWRPAWRAQARPRDTAKNIAACAAGSIRSTNSASLSASLAPTGTSRWAPSPIC